MCKEEVCHDDYPVARAFVAIFMMFSITFCVCLILALIVSYYSFKVFGLMCSQVYFSILTEGDPDEKKVK